MRPSALFYKNLRSATGKFAHSAVCGNTYAPLSKASTSYNSSDASTSLSAKKIKFNVRNRDVSDNESHFDSNEANICKNIQDNSQMQEVNDNIDLMEKEIVLIIYL